MRFVEQIQEGMDYLQSLSVDQIVDWWVDAAPQALPWRSAPFLRSLLDTGLRGNRLALDRFVELPGAEGRYGCFPRGVVAHWLAGNVPVLGLFSLLQALLTKNGSLIKLSDGSRELLPELLSSLAQVPTRSGVDGQRLMSSILLIELDREDLAGQEALSLAADLRLVWGGREGVEAVRGLPRKLYSEELIFGPRTSFALVGREEVGERTAERMAIDLLQLEQRGCNSPHTLFVERGGRRSPIEFARLVAEAVERRGAPELTLAAGEVGELLARRIEHEMWGEAFYPEGMEWSILYSEERGLAEPAYHHTLFVRPVDEIEEVEAYCSAETQTVGLAVSPGRREALVRRLMQRGVDRTPPLGQMTLYEQPWDGRFVLDRLVRWSRISF